VGLADQRTFISNLSMDRAKTAAWTASPSKFSAVGGRSRKKSVARGWRNGRKKRETTPTQLSFFKKNLYFSNSLRFVFFWVMGLSNSSEKQQIHVPDRAGVLFVVLGERIVGICDWSSPGVRVVMFVASLSANPKFRWCFPLRASLRGLCLAMHEWIQINAVRSTSHLTRL